MEGRLDSDKLEEFVEKNTQVDEKISIEEGYVSDKDESGIADSDTEFSGHRLKLRNEEYKIIIFFILNYVNRIFPFLVITELRLKI